jgi:hypothetical protein
LGRVLRELLQRVLQALASFVGRTCRTFAGNLPDQLAFTSDKKRRTP